MTMGRSSCRSCLTKVADALHFLPGLTDVTVSRAGPKGLTYYSADLAASLWYASPNLGKNLEVQTFDWDVTFIGLTGPQPLLKVRCSRPTSVKSIQVHYTRCIVYAGRVWKPRKLSRTID